MPCGDSVYMNHSCDSNVLDTGRGFDVVVRPIGKGAEASYDYRAFYDQDWGFECACGAENCCGSFRCRHPLPRGVRALWDANLRPALQRVKTVPQPLREALLDCVPGTARFFR
jgi:hypothetical protein